MDCKEWVVKATAVWVVWAWEWAEEWAANMQIYEFADRVRTLCARHSCSVSSWGRTERRNKLVGGSPNSQHLLWLAMDIVPDSWDDVDEIMFDAARLGLIAVEERSKNHIHLQAMPRA